MSETLGKRIIRHRKQLGLTQEQLAEQLGVTAQAVSKWENDQSCPDIAILPRLAEIFRSTTDELLGCARSEAVHTGELVESEAAEDRKDDNGFSFSWDGGRKSAIWLAVFVLFSGILYFLAELLVWDISFWDILWPSALLFFGASGLVPKFSFFRLGCMLLGGYFLAGKLWAFTLKLDSGLIFALVVILFGGSLLVDGIKKKGKPEFQFTYTDKFGNKHRGKNYSDYQTHTDSFTFDTSFGSSYQLIVIDTLRAGEISTSFGEYTVDFTPVKAIAPDASVSVDCSFGALKILVPKRIIVKTNNTTTFGEILIEGQADADAKDVLWLDASANFGEISIHYV